MSGGNALLFILLIQSVSPIAQDRDVEDMRISPHEAPSVPAAGGLWHGSAYVRWFRWVAFAWTCGFHRTRPHLCQLLAAYGTDRPTCGGFTGLRFESMVEPRQSKTPLAGALDSHGGEAGIPFPLRGNSGSALKRSARNAKNSPLGCFLNAFPPHRFESMVEPRQSKTPHGRGAGFSWRRGRDSNPGYRVHR